MKLDSLNKARILRFNYKNIKLIIVTRL